MNNKEFVLKLAVPLILILIFGLSTIWSTTPSLFLSQLLFVFIGITVMIIISRIPAQFLPILAIPSLVGAILLLLVTLLLGNITRGSVRWIEIGTFRLQTSEIIKPMLIISFAHFFSNKKESLQWLAKQLGILAVVVFLVFIQPDLGSAMIISAIWLGMFLISGPSKKQLLALVGLILVSIPSGWLFLQDYQKLRIFSFINPYTDPSGSGYNVIQSIIAIGAGQFLGKGVRQGTQSQLKFLPERHTDFAFAAFGEEFGFVGITLLLSAFVAILFWLLNAAERLKKFEKLIVLGVFWLIFVQFAINISMNLGLMPVTGITLPFVSYGGSSLVTSFASLGLVYSAYRGPVNT